MRKALLAVCLASACSDGLDVTSTSQPIVNGQLDTGDPATVYLDLGGGGCSGTLVSAKTIVTAKHCLSSQMTAFFGSDIDDEGTWISVVHKSGNANGDIAMLTLESEGPTTPIRLVNEDLATHLGEPIKIDTRAIEVTPAGDIWVATKDAAVKIDETGKELAKSPFGSEAQQAWIVAF